jgi:hypothetical protein
LRQSVDESSVKTLKKFSIQFTAWNALLILVVVLSTVAQPSLAAREIKLDTLQVGIVVFTNVTVLNTTKTDIFIQHAAGLANFKIKDLAPQTLKQLSGQVELPAEVKQETVSLPSRITTKITQQIADNPQFQALGGQWQNEMQQKLPPISKGLIAAMLGVFLVIYLFFCYCCKLIVQKTGNEAGLLIWLPLLQMFPLIRAAGMSGWWFILWLLPLVNILASVMWCFKIVEQRGKHVIWAILLLLPLTNVLAFLYLAFSEGVDEPREPDTLSLAEAA